MKSKVNDAMRVLKQDMDQDGNNLSHPSPGDDDGGDGDDDVGGGDGPSAHKGTHRFSDYTKAVALVATLRRHVGKRALLFCCPEEMTYHAHHNRYG
jgi:hypothetical protein